MKLLVLDFDGVISDSAQECFLVARRTYEELRAGSTLGEAEPDRLYRDFVEMIPLGNRAEDYGVELLALEAGVQLADQDAYEVFRDAQDPEWLRAFHARFYQIRTALSMEDPASWLRLMRPYARFLEVLRRRAGCCPYAIATSKDRRSVRLLLEDYGISDLFPDSLVLDKEAGKSKVAHHQQLARSLGLELSVMTFVDDKVNHLDSVAPLGVRCALAAWGYNGPREHALARARGYLICSLDDVEERLFAS